MHITITGNLGSGKSTVCKLLNEKYQFEIYSTGKVQRELAQQMNMTTLELNQLMCSDKKYDKMIDDETARISRENRDKDIIFDSRLAWHFVEKSFKVFVSVSLNVAAERVMNDQKRGSVEQYSSIEEAKKLLAERAATECVRYKDIYNLSYMDFSNYNLIIDSTYSLPDKIAEIIITEAKAFYNNNITDSSKMLVSPKRLLNIANITKEEETALQPLVKEFKNLPYAIDSLITVNKKDEDYEVVGDLDKAKAALLADVSYVPINVLKK
jgi:cytidylate kinase